MSTTDSRPPRTEILPQPNGSRRHYHVVDGLRGIAALGVCLFHTSSAATLEHGPLADAIRQVTSRGHLGVPVFFVISGFVIPLSMGDWRLDRKHLKTFLGRRMLRLHPPYVVASLLAIALWWLSSLVPGFQGQPLSISMTSLAANLTLTAEIFDVPWILVVAWTLAIEVQFYIAVMFALPLLVRPPTPLRLAALMAWIALPLASTNGDYLPVYAAHFGMGMAVYQRLQGRLGWMGLAASIAAAVAVVTSIHGRESMLAGLMTAIALLASPKPTRLLTYLGAISYSLYLVHVPIGGRVVNLGMRLPEFAGRGLVLMLMATAASVLAADVFYRLVEQRWISRSKSFGRSSCTGCPGQEGDRPALRESPEMESMTSPGAEQVAGRGSPRQQ